MLFPLIKLARGHINEKSCDSNTIGILRSLPALKQDNDNPLKLFICTMSISSSMSICLILLYVS